MPRNAMKFYFFPTTVSIIYHDNMTRRRESILTETSQRSGGEIPICVQTHKYTELQLIILTENVWCLV